MVSLLLHHEGDANNALHYVASFKHKKNYKWWDRPIY